MQEKKEILELFLWTFPEIVKALHLHLIGSRIDSLKLRLAISFIMLLYLFLLNTHKSNINIFI